MSLRVVGLTKAFNGVRALQGVTWEFADTGTTAIIGPNGAGKTSLINVVTGFERPDAGASFLGSVPTTRLAPDHIARLGVTRTFQEIRLVWRETVLENVMVAVRSSWEGLGRAMTPGGLREEDARIRSRAAEVLRAVGLEGRCDTVARELSYGQQKLLALCRCLAADARWLILDEPVSGVSPAIADEILATIRKSTSAGKAVVLIEHDIRAVREIADVIVVMDQGRVVASGGAEEVLARRDVMGAYLGQSERHRNQR